jgi:UDP-N-acetylmuramoyl-L-alanyl-D-glutamate--2,6-diaminopimelate ligase
MGRAVAQGADAAVLTSDNPRSEDPLAIMAMIRPGLEQGGMRPARELTGRGVYLAEPDRARAIALAVAAAGEEDVVLIAGKGHEDYQIVGHTRRHFDDREQAAAALAARGALGEGGCRASAGC